MSEIFDTRFKHSVTGVSNDRYSKNIFSMADAMNENNSFTMIGRSFKFCLTTKHTVDNNFFRISGVDADAGGERVILVGNYASKFGAMETGKVYYISNVIVYPKSRLIVLCSESEVIASEESLKIQSEPIASDELYIGENPFLTEVASKENGDYLITSGLVVAADGMTYCNNESERNFCWKKFRLETRANRKLLVKAYDEFAYIPFSGSVLRLYAGRKDEFAGEAYLSLVDQSVVEDVVEWGSLEMVWNEENGCYNFNGCKVQMLEQ